MNKNDSNFITIILIHLLFSIICKKLNMFIDVTKICNKLGSECVTINGEYPDDDKIINNK